MAATRRVAPPSDRASDTTTNQYSRQSCSSMKQIRPWLARFRVVEFSLPVVLIILANQASQFPVYQREIPRIVIRISQSQVVYARDPTLDNQKLEEQVPMVALVVVATSVVVLVNLFVNFVLPKLTSVRVIPYDTRDFLLSLLQSIGLSQVLTQLIKPLAGRFRPCFYDMCKWNYDAEWDGKTNLCQDAAWEREARVSFPSGHSSYAWCTLLLLTLYLLGRLRVTRESESLVRGGLATLQLFLCLLPTVAAIWIATTRSMDNWHHYTDIVTGSVLGASAACFSYSYNYGSIFDDEAAGVPLRELRRRRKKEDLELPVTKRDVATQPARTICVQEHG